MLAQMPAMVAPQDDHRPLAQLQSVQFVQDLRKLDLYKLPGVAETLDWAQALVALDAKELQLPLVEDTLGLLLKYQDDFEAVRKEHAQSLISHARQATAERLLDGQPFIG